MKNYQIKKILKNLAKNNIVILGHMGSGKTIMGKIFAKKLNLRHFDSDQEIVKFTKKSINEIFSENGEKYFREIEQQIVLNLIDKKNTILSLGGGSILNSQIRNKLQEFSLTIFLDVNLNELEKRLFKSNKRPLLNNVNIKNKIKELDTQRRKYYLRSDIKIKNTQSTINTYKNFIKEFSSLHEKNS